MWEVWFTVVEYEYFIIIIFFFVNRIISHVDTEP